jgi:serine protease Do
VTLSREGAYLAWNAGKVNGVLESVLEAPASQTLIAALWTSADLKKDPTGGALIDSTGRLVGVMGEFYGDSTQPGYKGKEVAVAVGLIKQLVPALQQHVQDYPSVWLGVTYDMLTPALASDLGVSVDSGAIVEFVVPDAPADTAGIRAGTQVKVVDDIRYTVGGDIILSIDGTTLGGDNDLGTVLKALGDGKKVSVRFWRDGAVFTQDVDLAAHPIAGALASQIQ